MLTAALATTLAASAAAAAGWMREASAEQAPSIAIVDVRPLFTDDAALHDLITHTFAVRVAISGFELLPYRPGVSAADGRTDAGHWRLYLDGHDLGDNLGSATDTYTPYLMPGTHWIAAELSNADSTSLRPPVWSEPVVLHVPRTIRCWQTGWHGSPESGAPRFSCLRHP
jgi:hypothetical protein